MKNRSKEWGHSADTLGGPLGGTLGGTLGPLDSLPPEAPLLVPTAYPHACVLRLRVVQIVCGISAMVMGSVGFIEEKGKLNLGLGIPAGAATVLAAAVSIHSSRSFSGAEVVLAGSRCGAGRCAGRYAGRCAGRWAACCGGWCGSLRSLGPIAASWLLACALHAVLILSAATTFTAQYRHRPEERNRDVCVVSLVQLSLSLATLAAEASLVAMECRRWPGPRD